MAYWVYVLQSETTGRYYVGSTADLEARLARHTANRSAATKGRGPWQLVYREAFPTRQAALARERAIKARKGRDYLETLRQSGAVG
jgi:putative endonuclease